MIAPAEEGSISLVDLKITLIKAFGWSLYDLDRTDIESLLPFVNRIGETVNPSGKRGKRQYGAKVHCDDPQASWL